MHTKPDKTAPIHNFAPATARLCGGCWPTPSQTMLLRAALLEPDKAVLAWEEWSRKEDFEEIDSGSFRLLGLVYRNLRQARVSDPLMPRLQGVYRRFWTANQLLLARNARLLRTFQEEGIPLMLTKGAALTVSAYDDFGVRPMEDLDLMVPRAQAVAATELLEKFGWEPEVLYSKELPETLHACHFRHDDFGIIDLHWQSFHVSTSEVFEAGAWEAALTRSLNGIEVKTPSHTDQFLRACEHGVRYNIVPPFRWLADSFHLWRASGGELDWERIAEGARLTESVLAVKHTLRFLRDRLEVPLPDEAFEIIDSTPVTLYERVESRLSRRPCRSLWDKLPVDFSWHLRSTRGQPMLRRLAEFACYFRRANNLQYGQFVAHCREATRRWFRTWLPYYIHRLARMFRPEPRGAVGSLPADAFQSFYDIEPCGRRLMRWSLPAAALRLKFPKGRNHFKVVLDTGGIRHWEKDLRRDLRFMLGGRPVPAVQVKEEQGVLTVRVYDVDTPETSDRRMTFGWTCGALFPKGDTRALGLPVFSVRVHTIKPPPMAARKPEAEMRTV